MVHKHAASFSILGGHVLGECDCHELGSDLAFRPQAQSGSKRRRHRASARAGAPQAALSGRSRLGLPQASARLPISHWAALMPATPVSLSTCGAAAALARRSRLVCK